MIKKHVFALSLALFVAGIVSVTTIGNAEARQKRTCHTHYQSEHRFNRWHCHTTDELSRHDTASTKSSDKPGNISPDRTMDAGRGSNTIRVADDYIGLTERANRRQLMNLFDFAFDHQIDPSRTKWCAAFVNGVLVKSGKKSTGSATAASFLKWGKRTSAPSMGDVVVLGLRGGGASHVGFYMGTTKTNGTRFVKVLGGNQRNSVKIAYYPVAKVLQYRTAD